MILRRLRSLLGTEGVVDVDGSGQPHVFPGSEDAVGIVLRAASAAGWKVRIEGSGSWLPPDSPADLVLSTKRLSSVTYLSPTDLVATAQTGIRWEELRGLLADQGTWIAADPPGDSRTLGSVIATGTAGPLRTAFGNIRDHLLGTTVITGDGRTVRSGGRVVKSVAGFDLNKLVAGSFGAFGVVTSVHLRLRAVPREDVTLVTNGPRDALVQDARAILDTGQTPSALELFSPRAVAGNEWTLAARLAGTPGEVGAIRDALRGAISRPFEGLDAREAGQLWQVTPTGLVEEPITLRLGAVPSGLDDALDLLAHHLSKAHHLADDWVSVTVSAGVVRWSGSATPDRLRLLRHAAAQREMPMTVERAPWPILDAVGHFGAYREGVARLNDRLRAIFDPSSILLVPLGSTS